MLLICSDMFICRSCKTIKQILICFYYMVYYAKLHIFYNIYWTYKTSISVLLKDLVRILNKYRLFSL